MPEKPTEDGEKVRENVGAVMQAAEREEKGWREYQKRDRIMACHWDARMAML